MKLSLDSFIPIAFTVGEILVFLVFFGGLEHFSAIFGEKISKKCKNVQIKNSIRSLYDNLPRHDFVIAASLASEPLAFGNFCN